MEREVLGKLFSLYKKYGYVEGFGKTNSEVGVVWEFWSSLGKKWKSAGVVW